MEIKPNYILYVAETLITLISLITFALLNLEKVKCALKGILLMDLKVVLDNV